MALIPCWECGGSVSGFAEMCPHCGAPQFRYWDVTVSYDKKGLEQGLADMLESSGEAGKGWALSQVIGSSSNGALIFTKYESRVRLCRRYTQALDGDSLPVPIGQKAGKGARLPADRDATPRPRKEGTLFLEPLGMGYCVTGCEREAGDVRIPAEAGGFPVTAVGNGTFEGAGLESVTLPDSVRSVGSRAFCGCQSLRAVVIGRGVREIGYRAFYDCPALHAVYYADAESLWDGIEAEEGNSPLYSAEIFFYSEARPARGGNFWRYDAKGRIAIW